MVLYPLVAALAAWMVLHGVSAQTSSGDPTTIEEITVVGRYPGPPLWKVTSGDRTLWLFGDLTPVQEPSSPHPASTQAR